MNILEIEDIIKGLPDQSLIQEAQAPSGQMPQFLVVSEIQRRADMRKRFQNQQQEMPQGTIADQILQSGIASMGNRQPIQSMPPQGMPPQGMPPMPAQGMPPQGMPPMPPQGMPMQQQPPMMPPMSPPMMPPAQGMAGGGVVRMQAGKVPPYTGGTEAGDLLREQQIESLLENFSNMPMSRQAAIAQQNIRDAYGESGAGAAFGQAVRELIPYGASIAKPLVGLATTEPLKALEQIFTGKVEYTKTNPLFGQASTPATELPTPNPLTTDGQGSAMGLQTASPMMGGNASQTDGKRLVENSIDQSPEQIKETLDPALNTNDPKKTDEMDKKKDSDYSSLMAALDQFKPVDYSAFKPDYLNLITEQERRAQKIRDDASKDASAQALIQLGAGLAAGDISKGLSAAGQSVADIKRQARAEARDEEGFARQLRLAQDEAGMELGIKGAEAERELARFKATYGVSLKDLENTMTLARERIDAEADTEAGRMLRGRLEGLNNLIKNLVSDPFAGDIEQNKAAIAQAVAEMKSLLGITDEKQNEKKDTDVIEAARSVLGNQ
jgi:hypothetical protein